MSLLTIVNGRVQDSLSFFSFFSFGPGIFEEYSIRSLGSPMRYDFLLKSPVSYGSYIFSLRAFMDTDLESIIALY